MSEFELIGRFFTGRQAPVPHVPLGVGDDCALMVLRSDMQCAISTDMLVEGRHFFHGADPRMLGHKSLAVNLSDLAAMGAEPRTFTLALALPDIDHEWLREYSKGLLELADRFGCQLIGGDTTKGPLNISITVCGEVPVGQALRRNAARVGDDIWITGTLGDANLALKACLDQVQLDIAARAQAEQRLHRPEPRIAAGIALRNIANAAIDISDGLMGDLAHILEQSEVGATVCCDHLPFGAVLALQDKTLRYHCALSGGDDYELCFTAPAERRDQVLQAMAAVDTKVTRVGQIESTAGLRLVDSENKPLERSYRSFDHFRHDN
jgi:thiamine-monophosphate kinase